MATEASMAYNGIYLMPTDNENLGGYVHERFPPGIKLGTPRYKRNTIMDNDGSTPRKLDSTSYRDRMNSVALPRLPYDNYPLTPRRNKNCSYVENHKTYLRLKGYQLNDVYSIKRRRSDSDVKNDVKSSTDQVTMKKLSVGSTVDLPPVFAPDGRSPRDKRRPWQTIQEEVWRPEESRRVPPGVVSVNRHLDKEMHVPGHIRSRDANSVKLGKVLTQSKLRQLLSEDKIPLPSAFYL